MATGRVPTTANSPLTAKGDLFGYSTTQARVPVGNDGETLVADSSASTGLKWQEPKAGNPLINSAFQVWQRGTSFTGPADLAYTADRWQYYGVNSTNFTVSRQTTSDTTNLPNIQYAARIQRTNGSTATNTQYLYQSMETANSIPFAGKTVTLSFYARRGSNFSASSNIVIAELVTGTGTDQSTLSGFTGAAAQIAQNTTLTTTWQRFSYSATIPTTATEIAVGFKFTPTGTAGAADWMEVTGVQLEVGSVATPFKTQGVTLAGELAACQRYYWRISSSDTGQTTNYLGFANGYATSTTNGRFTIYPPVTLRTGPTSLDYSQLVMADGAGGGFNPTAIAVDTSARTVLSLSFTTTGLTQFRPYALIVNGTTTGYLAFSAEL